MTRDDIIRWACEAYGVEEHIKPLHGSCIPPLEHFARLVAESERNACALVVRSFEDHYRYVDDIIDAIRARGNN